MGVASHSVKWRHAWAKPLLPKRGIRAYSAQMHGFIYFNITDHARLPARFFGMTRTILAQA